MTKKRIIIKLFIIFFILIISSLSNISLAESKTIETDILNPNFTNEFDPSKDADEGLTGPFTKIIVKVANRILTILQILGGIIFVISLAMAGLNGIFSAHSGIADDLNLNVGKTTNDYNKEIMGSLNKGALSRIIRRSAIGSIFLFSSTTIVKIVFHLFSSI